MPVLGIDVGTQSLKAVVLSEAMKLLGSGSVSYQPTFPRSGWAEQDQTLWLQALAPAIGLALRHAGLEPAAIAGLCVCGQLDGCVPTDAKGAARGPAIIWMDRRAEGVLSNIDATMVTNGQIKALGSPRPGGRLTVKGGIVAGQGVSFGNVYAQQRNYSYQAPDPALPLPFTTTITSYRVSRGKYAQ